MSLGTGLAATEKQASSYILFIAPNLRDQIEQDIRNGWQTPPHRLGGQKNKRQRLEPPPSKTYTWNYVDLSSRSEATSPLEAGDVPPRTLLFVPETIPADSQSPADTGSGTPEYPPATRRLLDFSSNDVSNTLAVARTNASLTQHSSVSLDVQNLPDRGLRFSCVDLVTISELLSNPLRFLPLKYQPPHVKSADPSPPPMIGLNPHKRPKLTFSCLALIRHIAVVEEATVPPWLRKNGQRKEIFDRCELKLVGQDGAGINLVLERELVAEWIRDEEDSFEASKSFGSAASRDRGVSPDKGGITLALMETMQLSGDSRALEPPRRQVIPRKLPAADQPTGLREGDVIAITGAVLEPFNPRKEDAAGNPRRLGMTRNTNASKKTTVQQPPVAVTTVWDGVRALLNPQSSSTCGIELCYRSEMLSPADAQWRFDPALASIDERYAQVWQLVEIWRRLKDLAAH